MKIHSPIFPFPYELLFTCIFSLIPQWVQAHDPVFGLGPHVLYKDGIEFSPEFEMGKSGNEKEQSLSAELTYGLTGDWALGIDLPYLEKSNVGNTEQGMGDLSIFTKYRFWRQDSPGLQQSLSMLFKVKTNTGNKNVVSNAIDGIAGLAYGYEGRKWYHWGAMRYRINGTNDFGIHRGNKLLFDLVGGIRPHQTAYTEPDTVWLLELNGEFSQKSTYNGVDLSNTGGSEWFVSPGIFWTVRNFAIKAGVQIPVISQLNGNQDPSDYRAKLVLEWHL